MDVVQQTAISFALREHLAGEWGARSNEPAGDSGQARHVADPAVIRRGHGLIPRRRFRRIRYTDHLTELHREVDCRVGVRPALQVVSPKELGCGSTVEHEVEFPTEIRSIAEPGTHTLPGKWRHLVRCISGKEDTTDLPLR